MILGVPNRVIHVLKNALVTVSTDVSGIGIASDHLVVLSIIVRQYLDPLELGSGPMISMLESIIWDWYLFWSSVSVSMNFCFLTR